VLLLDEPLAALDAHTKGTVRGELQELLAELALPALVVTHDYEDAAVMAETVGVLVDGELRQLGSPADLVSQPADPFVASFTGANLLHGQAEPAGALTRVTLEDGTSIVTVDEGRGAVVVAVYPWDVVVSTQRPDDSAMNVIAGPVMSLVELGNRVRVTIGQIGADVTAESVARLQLSIGHLAFASFKATGTRLV